MKTFQAFILALIMIFPSINSKAQNGSDNKFEPGTEYKVHREYDENGNLIGYDSTSITRWSHAPGNSAQDSLSDIWSYTPNVDDSVYSSQPYPKQYGFSFPGDEFYEFPQFDFGINFQDMDSLLKGFDFYFSLEPGDSVGSSNDPYLDFYGQFPPVNPNIHSYIEDMERMIDEMMDRHDDVFKDFNDNEDLKPQKNEDATDSIPSQQIPEPESQPQNYSGPVLNI